MSFQPVLPTEAELPNLNPRELLLDMLTYARPHKSFAEAQFIKTFIRPLVKHPNVEAMFEDSIGNLYVKTFGAGKVLYTAHTDTVHHTGGHQEVHVDFEDTVFVDAKSDCLGADNGAGVWLLIEMIKAGVPCWVQFTRGEERGCIGSEHTRKTYPEWLGSFDHAIAFDRKGNTSIITHQRGARACSDALGLQLASLLNLGHQLDPTGVYTDTATYMDIIPECVNISVGYQSEHSHNETLDLSYLLKLREAMIAVDWANTTLVTERDPKSFGFGGYGYEDDIPSVEQLMSCDSWELEEWICDNRPEVIAQAMFKLLDEIYFARVRYNTMKINKDVADFNNGGDETKLKVGL
jgi:hypothetical protein